MNGNIQEFIRQLKTNPKLITFDEAQTKQALILPLLQHLGWNPFNIDEVTPEFPVENRKIDFALRINNVSEFFIEVKKTSEDLERHQKQLLDYSFRAGVALAALTNGITWWFYLPTQKGEWQERKFYAIDIMQQESVDISSKFIDFLSKENVQKDIAFSNAEKLYKSKRKKDLLNKTLPEAWNKLVTEPDSFLVELLVETTEKLCGFKPDDEFVSKFFKENKNNLVILENVGNDFYTSQKKLKKPTAYDLNKEIQADISPSIYDLNMNEQRDLGRKGYEQIDHYIIPVIRLIKSGREHTEVFHEIAKKLDVTYQTVSAQCTRQLKLTTNKFLEYVENGQILNLLEIKYPNKKGILRKELGPFYHIS